jgi:hypothetical protein
MLFAQENEEQDDQDDDSTTKRRAKWRRQPTTSVRSRRRWTPRRGLSNVRRAIDIHEGDKVNEAALKDFIRAAVALNLKSKPKPRRASSKRAD